jgi:hypothetical protein
MTGGLTALFDIAVVINYATGYERAIWLLKQ